MTKHTQLLLLLPLGDISIERPQATERYQYKETTGYREISV